MTNQNEARVKLTKIPGKSIGYTAARNELEPEVRHGALASNTSSDLFKGETADVAGLAEAMQDMSSEIAAQNMTTVTRLLTAQALSLDALFTQMARKAHANLGHYPDAVERYLRLGMKAQAQSRATLEALVKLHQPREQTVRHVHVGPDGQAVFIENYNGGMGHARFDGRPHAQGASGPALLGEDAKGNGVPIPGGSGEAPLPHARRRARQRRPDRE